ncbi:MAG: RluA family pseudouridine synthase [bacterium]|nr:RluA family pseudouridine synthase [bacterium]MDZ4299312.1 RluA family pseudouridine synthase [Candidatus Sungbacteria bacterium]
MGEKKLEIIYADDALIVINKPPGISSHGGVSVSGETVASLLVRQFPELAGVGDDPAVRPGIVHRLDKETSGVMVAARTQESFLALKALFMARQVQKTYRAIVCGTLLHRVGTIDLPIGRMVRNPLKRAVQNGKTILSGVRDAYTEYRVLAEKNNFSLVELKPKTGRMHQLRVHLAALGNPIACDTRYGSARVCCPAGAKRVLLHAQRITFTLTPGHPLAFETDPPEDFGLAMAQIV